MKFQLFVLVAGQWVAAGEPIEAKSRRIVMGIIRSDGTFHLKNGCWKVRAI